MSAYELYHDESLKGGYWQGMLLVPVAKKDAILRLLETEGHNVVYPHIVIVR